MRHDRREGHHRDGGAEHVNRVPSSTALECQQSCASANDWPSCRFAVQQRWVRDDPLNNVPQRSRCGVNFEARQLLVAVCRLDGTDSDEAANGRHFGCLIEERKNMSNGGVVET